MSEHTYLAAMDDILKHGVYKEDRTGTGTYSMHGMQMRYDLRRGFPLMTTKKVFMRGIVHELLWFIKGDTNIRYLKENGVSIWGDWADPEGNLGPVYGKQWRSWEGVDGKIIQNIDQLQGVIDGLKKDPYGRRHIVSAWNVVEIPHMALPPCHTMFQFIAAPISYPERLGMYVHKYHNDLTNYFKDEQESIMDELGIPRFHLDLVLYQRSGDMFLGVPFNVASYSLLLMMVAQLTGMVPREFIHHVTDAHIYSNHVEQVKEQLTREPYQFPTLSIAHRASIDDFTFNDFVLEGYEHHPAIKGKVAV